MKANRIYKYGGPEQLRYEDAPVPEAEKDEALVRVYAASINPFDYKLAAGAFRERIPPGTTVHSGSRFFRGR